MKKMRKGFTLIELLIVISILGTLSAAMSASMGKSTAAAKASTIAANIDTCMTAAKLYYAENFNENLTTKDASEFLSDTSTYISNWKKFTTADKNIVYGVDKAVKSGQGVDNWTVQVDFSNAPDKDAILAAFRKIPGYDDEDTSKLLPDSGNKKVYKFGVALLTGKVKPFVTQTTTNP